MSKVFDFEQDLKKGKESEEEFRKRFPIKLIALNGTGSDFMTLDFENSIEVKCDSHDTGNFFFERYSSKETQSPGGPWQADLKHSQWFIVWFSKTSTFYIFHTAELVQFLNEYIKTKTPKIHDVYNKGYTSQGIAVRIKDLQHLFYDIDEQYLQDNLNTESEMSNQLKNGFALKKEKAG